MDWKEQLRANAESVRKKAEQNSPTQHAAFMDVVRVAFTEFKSELAELDGLYR